MNRRTSNISLLAVVVVTVLATAWFKARPTDADHRFDPASAAVASETAVSTEPTPIPEQPAVDAEQQPAAAVPRLVDLGAKQCEACKKLAPILDELREEFRDRLDVVFIDVWEDPDAKQPYNIRLIPTQILFDARGNELWRHEGFISKQDLVAVFAEQAGVE